VWCWHEDPKPTFVIAFKEISLIESQSTNPVKENKGEKRQSAAAISIRYDGALCICHQQNPEYPIDGSLGHPRRSSKIEI
jgi:hypothetical protein